MKRARLFITAAVIIAALVPAAATAAANKWELENLTVYTEPRLVGVPGFEGWILLEAIAPDGFRTELYCEAGKWADRCRSAKLGQLIKVAKGQLSNLRQVTPTARAPRTILVVNREFRLKGASRLQRAAEAFRN